MTRIILNDYQKYDDGRNSLELLLKEIQSLLFRNTEKKLHEEDPIRPEKNYFY